MPERSSTPTLNPGPGSPVSEPVLCGYRIHYREAGSGKALLFIHGFAGASAFWTNILQALPQGFRGIAPDLLGFGDSDKPRTGYSIAGHAEIILELTRALEIPEFDLIGHSMGGLIALTVALQSPQKVGKLVLVNTPVHGARGLHGRGRMGATLLGLGLVRLGLQIPFVLWALRKWPRYYFVLDPRFTDEARKAPFYSLRGHAEAMRVTDLSPRLKEVSLPTLVIGTDQDGIVRASEFALAAQQIPGAGQVCIRDAGHCPTLEKPRESREALFGFLMS